MRYILPGLLAAWIGAVGVARAQDAADAAPAAYELASIECGELDNDAGLVPLRTTHTAGEDMDLLCKVKVTLAAGAKGVPKAHTVTFTVFQDKKTTYQQVRDVRVLTPGSRTILFVIPAEKLPTEGGKVKLRAELSKPATKPHLRELTYELNAED